MVVPDLGGQIEHDLCGIANAEGCSLANVVEAQWHCMTPRTVC